VPALCCSLRYSDCMVAITIRNIPNDIRDELAARAARSGRSLQEYLAAELISIASRREVADVLAAARARTAATRRRLDRRTILAARDHGRR
jgi:plasmid stability protein